MSSEADIKKAFQGGDGDADDGLSLSEAGTALEKLSGRYVGQSTIQSACSSCGVSTSGREMNFNEFVSVVRHLEGNGTL